MSYLDENKKIWESLHEKGRHRPNYPTEDVVRWFFKNFERNGTEKILDLGCGGGANTLLIAENQAIAFGVDLSNSAVKWTKKRLQDHGFEGDIRQASVTDLPFETEFFDGLFSYGVLYYCKIEEINKAVQEIYRVLKKGGQALIYIRTTEDHRFGQGKEIEKNTFLLETEEHTGSEKAESGMVMHFFERSEVEKLFSSFSDIEITKVDYDTEGIKESNFLIVLKK